MCLLRAQRREREYDRSNRRRDNSWEFSKSDERHHHHTDSRSRINKERSTPRSKAKKDRWTPKMRGKPSSIYKGKRTILKRRRGLTADSPPSTVETRQQWDCLLGLLRERGPDRSLILSFMPLKLSFLRGFWRWTNLSSNTSCLKSSLCSLSVKHSWWNSVARLYKPPGTRQLLNKTEPRLLHFL